MTTYTSVFGGANIYPAEISYSSLTLTADVTLSWPQETSTNTNLATRIIDVTASTSGKSIILPEANKAGVGETILFNNLGAQTVSIKNSTGTQILSLTNGTLWQIYLTANTTAAGSWQILQYGAATSQANASALAGTGIVAVGTLLSQSVPITTFNSNYTSGTADRAKMFVWNGSGSGTFTLSTAPTVGSNWFCYVRNSGGGSLTVDPQGSETINGELSLSFAPGDSAIVATDGVSFYTIGFGQQAIFAFDYTVIAVGGTGNYTLAGSELNRIAYDFTGVLTGNRNIIVPATVQQYWITNDTTGAFTLTVKTSAGTGIAVGQGSSAILYCNGTNVVSASTAGISIPISVAQGGTSSTTAGGALINLGGTSTGIAVFTAATQAAAYAALGVAPSGVVNGGTY
jgi:hypothetical protein